MRVTTRLVQVSVIAEDKTGQPVVGLTSEDFRVFDGGRPEQIVHFGAEALDRAGRQVRSLPPGVFSNHIDDAATGASCTVILLDGLNTPIPDQAYARRQIEDFLAGLRPDDRVAIYALGRGPRVLQEFTSDPAVLRAALAAAHRDIPHSLDVPLQNPTMGPGMRLDAWLGEVSLNLVQHFASDRSYRTVRCLEAIANHLDRIPGRKSLVWVSATFPVWLGRNSLARPRAVAGGLDQEIQRAVRALDAAGVAIYPVDARGLMAPAEYDPALGSIRPEAHWSKPDFGSMNMLADRTGGRVFANKNSLAAAFRRAAADGREAYTLAYRPTQVPWNGKFREIRVECSRPGVRLVYRHGYFAQPDEPADPAYREVVLGAVMWDPIDATGLGINVRAKRGADGGIDAQIDTDPRDLGQDRALDVWAVLLGADDRHLGTVSRTAKLPRDGKEPTSLVIALHIDPIAGAHTLRILVRGINSGAFGSLTIPIAQIP